MNRLSVFARYQQDRTGIRLKEGDAVVVAEPEKPVITAFSRYLRDKWGTTVENPKVN